MRLVEHGEDAEHPLQAIGFTHRAVILSLPRCWGYLPGGTLSSQIYWGYIYFAKTPRAFSTNPAKNVRNIALRGIDMAAGAKAFDFRHAIVSIDDRKDYGERREVAAGFIGARLHILVFTMRGETCHVISLRKANKRESRSYVEKSKELE